MCLLFNHHVVSEDREHLFQRLPSCFCLLAHSGSWSYSLMITVFTCYSVNVFLFSEY